MLYFIALLSADAQACGSQRHFLGGFVAFDAEQGWWAWDGLSHTDNDVYGDALSEHNRIVLLRYDSEGVPVEAIYPPQPLLEKAYFAQSKLAGADHTYGAIRPAMDERALLAVAKTLLSDRSPVWPVSMSPGVATLELPDLLRPCQARLMVLRGSDGQRVVHRVQGYEATPNIDVEMQWGHGQVLTPEPRMWAHPEGRWVVAEMMWGLRGQAHGVSRTEHVVLDLDRCVGEACARPLDAGSCEPSSAEPFDQGPGGWLRVRRVAADDVLFLRDRPSTAGAVLGSLAPEERCIWGHLPTANGARDWAWLPGRGWAHGYYLVEDAQGCLQEGERPSP